MKLRRVSWFVVLLSAVASAGSASAQQSQQVGFWRARGAHIQNTNTGNVGIGTATPTAKLEVAGSAKVGGTLTIDAPGDNALDLGGGCLYKDGALFLHTKGGLHNVALGFDVLDNVTSGYENTAIGDLALRDNTSGALNVAVGPNALRTNTTGRYNTAIGPQALFANTTGYGNVAVGAFAMVFNSTGDENTALGDAALLANTTGSELVAVGSGALVSNTTGYDNIAVGARALRENTTGHGNQAFGARALYSNTTGERNIAIGSEALYSSTIGADNIAIGEGALRSYTFHNFSYGRNVAIGTNVLGSMTEGGGSTAVGFESLANATGTFGYNTALGLRTLRNLTTGSSNLALGVNAGYYTTGDANIMIASIGVAGESNTTRIGGVQTRTFISGIRGRTTGNADAIPVLIDSFGQLGTVSSSRRFKEDVEDMGAVTDKLLELRPVTFRYKPEVQRGERPREYGLIAEEVAEVFPDLVVYDEEGEPFTVKYHILSSMLLNELEKLADRHSVLAERFDAAAAANAEQARELAELRDRLGALEASSGR